MDRKSFFKKLGIGVGVAVAAPMVAKDLFKDVPLKEIEETPPPKYTPTYSGVVSTCLDDVHGDRHLWSKAEIEAEYRFLHALDTHILHGNIR